MEKQRVAFMNTEGKEDGCLMLPVSVKPINGVYGFARIGKERHDIRKSEGKLVVQR